MRILALIPARGQSKRLPRKNVLPFAGRPLIGRTIDAALGASCVTKTIVSTDDEEIAAISRDCGAETPFMRPDALSSDEAKSIDVVIHAIEFFAEKGENFDAVCLLQPTSPLRTSADIDGAYRVMQEKNAGSVVSVCPTEHSPLWCNALPEDGSMQHFLNEAAQKRSQDLPDFYRLNGAVYLAKTENVLRQKTLLYSDSYAYVMPCERSADIDTKLDFIVAEAIEAFSKKGAA